MSRQDFSSLTDTDLGRVLRASDSVEFVLSAYFDGYTIPVIEKTIRDFGDDHLREVVSYVYMATNSTEEKSEKYLSDFYSSYGVEADLTRNVFRVFSKRARGEVVDADPLWANVRRISDLPDELLKKQIGCYLKEKTNNYLCERFPEIFAEITRGEIANDEHPSASVESAAAAPLSESSSKERMW